MGEALAGRQSDMARVMNDRLDAVTHRVGQSMEQSTRNTMDSLRHLHERLAVIDNAHKNLTDLTTQVTTLRDVLANKQTRGAFGQARMEAIVQDGMPKGSYEFQFTLSNNKRPDCVVFLPDQRPLCIDAKFPLEAVTALRDARSDEEKKVATQRVRQDMMKHVNDIAQKYLIIGETQEMALLFVPSESVYAEIHDGFDDVIQKAYRARVVLVSPSLLMLAIQVMQQILKDARMREAADQIRTEVFGMTDDLTRLRERVMKLQQHFGQANEDVRQILISADKIDKRKARIEDLDFDKVGGRRLAAAREAGTVLRADPQAAGGGVDLFGASPREAAPRNDRVKNSAESATKARMTASEARPRPQSPPTADLGRDAGRLPAAARADRPVPRLLLRLAAGADDSTLLLWMRESGVDLGTIGLFALVGTPYTIKFLWAPVIDALNVPLLSRALGRRRGWLVFSQLLLIAAILMLALTDPAKSPLYVALGALLVATASATQDTVVDAFRVESLRENEQAAGMAAYVAAYRIGTLVSTAGSTLLVTGFESTGLGKSTAWTWGYVAMAAMIGIGMIASILATEPDAPRQGFGLGELSSPVRDHPPAIRLAHNMPASGVAANDKIADRQSRFRRVLRISSRRKDAWAVLAFVSFQVHRCIFRQHDRAVRDRSRLHAQSTMQRSSRASGLPRR